MNTLTYEIIAKYIGKEYRVKVQFDPNIPTAQADVKTNTITMPDKITKENAYAGLALLIHEASHLRYTKKLPQDLATNRTEFNVLNILEDIRVDNKNFQLLPNIKDFYEKLYGIYHKASKDVNMSKVPVENKAIYNVMNTLRGVPQFTINDKETTEFIKVNNLKTLIENAIRNMEYKDWAKVKTAISELIKIFKWDKNPPPEITTTEMMLTSGKGDKGEGQGASGKGDQEGTGVTLGKIDSDKAKEIFGTGEGKGSQTVTDGHIGKVALHEQTKNQFKDLLNIKETYYVDDGDQVNTENLLSLYTNNIDELFEEEKIKSRRKSKIIFVLDASGSMGTTLLCGSKRRDTVANCVKDITQILDEVRLIEGTEIEYQVTAFDERFYELNQSNWVNEYFQHSGGTNLLNAFEKAQNILLKTPEIDGHKLIVLFTDGDVQQEQITEMKKLILRHNADVRCMIIGVGSGIASFFVQEIVQDFNIISSEMADRVLLDAIMEML